MSDVQSIKTSLLNAQWREYSRVTVEGNAGSVELVIRRPPDSVLSSLIHEADEARKATEGEGSQQALLFRSRLVATCVFLPGAVTPLFTPAEAFGWPGLGEVVNDCMAAINPSKGLEAARGK